MRLIELLTECEQQVEGDKVCNKKKKHTCCLGNVAHVLINSWGVSSSHSSVMCTPSEKNYKNKSTDKEVPSYQCLEETSLPNQKKMLIIQVLW